MLLIIAMHWQWIYSQKSSKMSIYEVTHNENVTWYKVDLPSPTVHSHGGGNAPKNELLSSYGW